MSFLAIPVALALAMATFPVGQAEVQTVPQVDLERYLGRWYEVARFPNDFQKDCAGDVRATYSKRTDGRLKVLNECSTRDGKEKSAEGVARVVDATTNAKLKVRFAPAFLSWISAVWGDYWILGLDRDYRWATVGSPDRKYLWILSRTPQIGEAEYDRAVKHATDNGFDGSRLVRTPQR